jgi:hypothetical protein
VARCLEEFRALQPWKGLEERESNSRKL